MRIGGRLLRGSLLRNLELAILLGVTFAMTPVLVHSLGSRMYGYWTLLATLIGYYGLLDLGLSSAAARYISRSLGSGDEEELASVVSTAFVLFCLLGAGVMAAAAALSLACPRLVSDPDEARLLSRLVLLLGAATAAGFPVRVHMGILTANLRYDDLSYAAIARTVLGNAAVYVVLRRGGGLWAASLVTAATVLLQSAAIYAACRARFPSVAVRLSRFDRSQARRLLDHGWKNFVCALTDIVRFRMGSALIAATVGVGMVTPYAVGVRIVDGFCGLVMGSFGMMQPVFSRYQGQGDAESIRSALLRVTRLSTIASAFIGLSVLFYGRTFVLRWMGPGFESSYYVAAILSAAFLVELPQSPGVQLLYGLSRHGSYAALNAGAAALNLLLSLALIPRFGIYGVVLGAAAEIVLVKLFVLPFLVCREAGIPVRVYLVDTILVALLKAALPLAAYFAAIQDLVRPGYLRLLACGAGQAAVFVPIAYFLIMTPEERRLVEELVGGLRRRAESPGRADAAA